MKKEELKPCPFCGGFAYIEDCWHDGRVLPMKFIVCNGCGCRTYDCTNKKEAFDTWNRRAV